MENTTIITNDAAGQVLQIVIVPGIAWVVKDRVGNEIANVMPPDQLSIIKTAIAGDAGIQRLIASDYINLHTQVVVYAEALQKIINYADSGTTIGNLEGCKAIAKNAIDSLHF